MKINELQWGQIGSVSTYIVEMVVVQIMDRARNERRLDVSHGEVERLSVCHGVWLPQLVSHPDIEFWRRCTVEVTEPCHVILSKARDVKWRDLTSWRDLGQPLKTRMIGYIRVRLATWREISQARSAGGGGSGDECVAGACKRAAIIFTACSHCVRRCRMRSTRNVAATASTRLREARSRRLSHRKQLPHLGRVCVLAPRRRLKCVAEELGRVKFVGPELLRKHGLDCADACFLRSFCAEMGSKRAHGIPQI